MVTKKAASKKKSAKKKAPAKRRTTSSRSYQQSEPKTPPSNQRDLDGCGIATYESNTLSLVMSGEEGCEVVIDIKVNDQLVLHCVWDGSQWVCD